MIRVEGLCKKLAGQDILRGISVSVPQGATKVILGLSGSGKSVLMKHLIGLMKPDKGHIWVDGEEITQLPPRRLLRVRRKFGMVFQQSALFDSLTVFENVAFPLREHTHLSYSSMQDKVLEKLELLGLSGKENKYPGELSGGMRKRVALARAVVLDPAVVLYDEPTTGLDPLSTENVDAMIIEAKSRFRVTSVVISHDIASAFRIADEIAILNQGRIVADGNLDTIKQSSDPFAQKFLASYLFHQ
jgi:phospholipid/cholesterol/gamma-HCH transport system ATP-binding protein